MEEVYKSERENKPLATKSSRKVKKWKLVYCLSITRSS
jgi:hypothetical protein